MNIEELAYRFRDAIEKAQKAGEFTIHDCFYHFPRGCCGDTSDLLAQYFLNYGIKTYYVCGEYEPEFQTHAWLVTEDKKILIDITGDQFKDRSEYLYYDKKVYVGELDEFHNLFKVEDRNVRKNRGLAALGTMCQPRLRKLYSTIIEYL